MSFVVFIDFLTKKFCRVSTLPRLNLRIQSIGLRKKHPNVPEIVVKKLQLNRASHGMIVWQIIEPVYRIVKFRINILCRIYWMFAVWLCCSNENVSVQQNVYFVIHMQIYVLLNIMLSTVKYWTFKCLTIYNLSWHWNQR